MGTPTARNIVPAGSEYAETGSFSYGQPWDKRPRRPGAEPITVGGPKLHSYRVVTATAGLDVVQSGRPIFDDFFQHLWPYIGNNTANVVFQMVKRL
ncbi:hypothetical protein TNCV_2872401 [Trichonephila clavipes]|nr:hypothetical protein TNCV_2872401 [Trichonephila clavipes]